MSCTHSISSYVKEVAERFAALAAPLAILFALGQVAQPVVLASTPATGCVQAQLELIVAPESSVTSKLSIERLAEEIAARRFRVPEFRFIAEEAKRRGLRVWLFGGTAAGYTHYVKWDVLRELGDTRFQANRFDYDYTNIFRSTQDLDIVVDGTVEQAKGLEQALKAQFPYFTGSKATPWEVRSLTQDTDGKGGILGDFGFMNQHTDSHSTGMVELTDPPMGESVVRDVRDWKNTNGAQFLKDAHEGKLTYYFSPTHEQTPRAKEGKNPPIFAVTRAFTKAFQYDLKLSDDKFKLFQKVINEFDPKRDLANPDAARWMEKNGKKLYEHSVDLENSRRVLDELGLREKLLQIKNNPSEKGSLSWWMNKQPLESKPVGQGTGRTARELGITTVAHETSDFLAYESITRSHTGKPNVFISRENAEGETAKHGSRFYTAKGNKGAKGTGITIRSTVDPNAREGWDFDLAEIKYTPDGKIADGTQVNFQNRNAFTIIPESIDMTPAGYFKFLAESKTISEDDKAILWKFKRKLDHTIISGQIPANEMEEIRSIVLTQLKGNATNRDVVVSEWLRIELAWLKKDPNEIERFFDALKTKTYEADPAALFTMLTDASRKTVLEEYVTKEWLPSLINLKTLKTDIGDRALESCLNSSNSDLREFGARVLADRKARNFNPHKTSNVHVFEKLAGGKLPPGTKAESFQFVPFNFPEGGKHIQLGSEAERNVHEVTLTKSFEMQTTPVTQRQWLLVMGENPSNFKAGGELNLDRPVENVSWNDAQEFIDKMNKLDPNYNYRLPTEAEWEYAAGKDPDEFNVYGWHDKNAGHQTHDVASLKPNEHGLHDMHGNVWEWVQDWYGDYPAGNVVDPSGPASGSIRVLRGGGWNNDAQNLRAANRYNLAPSKRNISFGFRPVRSPISASK